MMSWLEIIGLAGSAAGAGAINAVAGGGTLLTFRPCWPSDFSRSWPTPPARWRWSIGTSGAMVGNRQYIQGRHALAAALSAGEHHRRADRQRTTDPHRQPDFFQTGSVLICSQRCCFSRKDFSGASPVRRGKKAACTLHVAERSCSNSRRHLWGIFRRWNRHFNAGHAGFRRDAEHLRDEDAENDARFADQSHRGHLVYAARAD